MALLYTARSSLFLLVVTVVSGARIGFPESTFHYRSTGRDDGVVEIVPSEIEGFTQRAREAGSARSKRQTSGAQNDLSFFSNLNDSHSSLLVSWAGSSSDAIVVLAKGASPQTSARSNLYVSYDYGFSYRNISARLQATGGLSALAIIDNAYHSAAPETSEQYMFTDVTNGMVIVTRDLLVYTPVRTSFKPSLLSIHPRYTSRVLAWDATLAYRALYLSTDFGSFWTLKRTNVKSFAWAEDWDDDPTAFYVEVDKGNGLALVLKFTLQPSFPEITTVIDNVVDFTIKDNYKFAIKMAGLSQPGYELWVGYKTNNLQKAAFPSNLNHLDYFLVDCSEDEIFICVSHEGVATTNLYISNENGTDFSLSLARVVYLNPSGPNSDALMKQLYRSGIPFADVYKVEGLDGIYIASQFVSNFSYGASWFSANQTTLITYDKGGQWQRIRAPYIDSQGAYTHCYWNQGCSLHLTQQFHSYFPQRYPSIYSSSNAIGVILATGIYGPSMKAISGTSMFLSSDAGYSWKQVLNGSNAFTMGDHGGLIIAVKQMEETNSIMYSANEGMTWQSLSFMSQDKMAVYGLLTEPGSKTGVFSLWGSLPGPHQWVIAQINLTKIFGGITCGPNDYKLWSPGAEDGDGSCLLGQRVQYERRRPNSFCYNGEDYERSMLVATCTCIRDDYECDFGYEVDSNSSTAACVRDSDVPDSEVSQVPVYCPAGSTYQSSIGYRKVSDDQCTGGNTLLYEPQTLPCPVTMQAEFIIYSTKTSIRRFLLASQREEILPISDLQEVISVEFDYLNNTVFWADRADDKIEKMVLDGRHQPETVVAGGLGKIESMTLDWESDNIYWIDVTSPAIEMAAKDGRWRRAIVTNTTVCQVPGSLQRIACLEKPRTLVVHPSHGIMFWTDWSSTPRIARSNMDGVNVSFIVADPQWVFWPNGLAIDYSAEQLYVADGYLHLIFRCDFYGHGLTTVVSGFAAVSHPFSLGIFGSSVYWTDWGDWKLKAADRATGLGVRALATFPISANTRPMALKVMDWRLQLSSGACDRVANGECTHLCVPVPPTGAAEHTVSTHSCLCSDGFIRTTRVLSEGHEVCSCNNSLGQTLGADGYCHTRNQTSCSWNQFACSFGRCIPSNWRCDHDNDCGDFSDERNCSYATCAYDQFKCLSNERCIMARWRCDHDNDCGDFSDELDCVFPACSRDQFTCANRRCISSSFRCDGDNDCRDMSDEINCTSRPSTLPPTRLPSTSCPPGDFACVRPGFGQPCIRRSWLCDGDRDCSDGSDEVNCTSAKNATVTCLNNQFLCTNRSACIPKGWVCDGANDCGDFSDEVACTPSTARPTVPSSNSSSCPWWMTILGGFYQCANGRCIHIRGRCDGLPNCQDGSDEVNCEATTRLWTSPTPVSRPSCNFQTQFKCFDGTCIAEAYVCNGFHDCSSGEDERGCPETDSVCPPTYFHCFLTQVCIPRSMVCDGRVDCGDGSDESTCQSGGQNPTASPLQPCVVGGFSCDLGQTCLSSEQVCDNRIDCADLSDEDPKLCIGMSGVVVRNLVVFGQNRSSAFFSWDPPEQPLKSMQYEPLYRLWKEDNLTPYLSCGRINVTHFTLSSLVPATNYMLRVRVISNNTQIYNQGTPTVLFTTTPDLPDTIQSLYVYIWPGDPFRWTVAARYRLPPAVSVAKVMYMPVSNTNRTRLADNRWTEAFCQQSTRINDYAICVFYVSRFYDESDYQVKVAGVNGVGTGPDSDVKLIRLGLSAEEVPSRVDSLTSAAIENDGITLVWNASRSSEGYTVEYLAVNGSVVQQNTTNTQIRIGGLSPHTYFSFVVIAYKGPVYGEPSNAMYFLTTGEAVPLLSMLTASAMGSSANLTWSVGRSSHTGLKYRVLVDSDPDDLTSTGGRCELSSDITTTALVLEHLNSCEMYFWLVYIISPFEGPRSDMASFTTPPAARAPPKHIAVALAESAQCIGGTRAYYVTWESACRSDPSVDYEVSVFSSTVPVVETILVSALSQKKAMVKLQEGGMTYNISVVRTAVNVSSVNFTFSTVPCSPPMVTMCTVNVLSGSAEVQQADGPLFSAVLSWTYDGVTCCSQRPLFEVWIAEGGEYSGFKLSASNLTAANGSLGLQYGTYIIPMVDSLLHSGASLVAKVRVAKSDGAKSDGAQQPTDFSDPFMCFLPGQHLPHTGNDSEATPLGHVIGASVGGVVSLLVFIMFSVWCVRRRRLRASFDSFASSHYDTITGVATIGSPDSKLSEEEDTPMISGFSDDEPLVIA